MKAISVIGADAGKGTGTDVLSYCRNPELTADGEAMEPESLVPARLPEKPGLPIIAVPTTSGTASETNGGAVLTDSDAATPRWVPRAIFRIQEGLVCCYRQTFDGSFSAVSKPSEH